MSLTTELPEEIRECLENGEIITRKYWKFIKELNSFNEKRLNNVALINGDEKITYREMFEQWEDFARVFSALDISEKNGSRAGLLSSRDVWSVNALYGLNMTGASVSLLHHLDILDRKRWDDLIRKEGITDLILTQEKVGNDDLDFIMENASRLQIRNVILMPAKTGQGKKKVKGVLSMKELLEQYREHDIDYGTEEPREDALIFHTSGTTNGIHKPVPLSDEGFNESAARLLRDERFCSIGEAVCVLAIELTAAYSCCDMLHLPLSYGGTVVLMPDEASGMDILKVAEKDKVTVLFSVGDSLRAFADQPIRPDLSNVKFVFAGGTYISGDAKKAILKSLKECGSGGSLYVGYGLTETGGAVTLTDGNCMEDSIGRPLSGVKVKIYDEDEEVFYDLSDGARTGVLFISSPSVSCGRLNGNTFFTHTDIDGEQYLNTYDLVDVREDGSLRIVGRMNKFFVNNDGIRFDAGIIETAVSAENGITACALAPEYNKMVHDTVPVLYVQMDESGKKSRDTVEDALYRIFVKEDKITETNLPSMVVITKSLPLNQTGKVDVKEIIKGGIKGKKYVIKPVRRRGKLIDVRVILRKDAGILASGGLPEELEYDAELYRELIEGRQLNMKETRRDTFRGPFIARVIRGFLDEMSEDDESFRKGRRRRRPRPFMDPDALYHGFGGYDEDEDEDEDDIDDEADEEIDDDDEEGEDSSERYRGCYACGPYDDDDDDDDDDPENRGCGGSRGRNRSGEKGDNAAMLMSMLGRYFNASDYDKFYEE